jgi:hypothetical protein
LLPPDFFSQASELSNTAMNKSLSLIMIINLENCIAHEEGLTIRPHPSENVLLSASFNNQDFV